MTQALVPPIVHQAWFGQQASWVQRRSGMMRELCEAQGITYMWWDDARIEAHPGARNVLPLYERFGLTDIRIAKDLLRMWIITRWGGIWMDNDIWPLVPLTSMVNRSGWVCANTEEGGSTKVTQQALFALPAGNPLTPWISARAVEQLKKGVTNAHFIAGPRTFREAEDRFPGHLEHLNALIQGPDHLTRAQAMEGIVDEERLRELYPGAMFVHIEPLGGAKKQEQKEGI